jgi:hypothetical protein
MSLTARITAIMQRVVVEVAGTTHGIGWRDDGVQSAPPRIDWRPTRHAYERAYQGGSRADGLQRAILGRSQTFELRIWGNDLTQTEALFGALVRACEAEAAGAWSYVGGDWARTGAMTCGEAMLCAITLGAHVLDAAPTLVLITGASLAPPTSTPGDGLLQLGES